MNEVTKIHLGRQAFTISIDAHHELKKYLEDITKQVGDKEVADEIELRMAELLIERGITANKVVLPGDIDFLKAQLGSPKDFKEDEDETDDSNSNQFESKRLFRASDDAILAGVASGLAHYFGVDVLLVRILFVVLVLITAGWGILLYIVLWLLVPEAKTSSERLQMAGKAVNVSSLKEIVERADVKGATHRASRTLADFINTLFRFVIKVIGIVFTLFGLTALFGLIAVITYILVDHNAWAQDNIFPVGLREHLLLGIATVVAALIASFVTMFGIAMFRRKWPIKNWVTGMLVGILLIGLAVGGALAGDIYPNVRYRYNTNVHSTVRTLTPFSNINIDGVVQNVNFITSNNYQVDLTYYDHPDLSNVKTIVKNNSLTIDTTQFNPNRNCSSICIPSTYNLAINVYAPDAMELANQTGFVPPQPPQPVVKPW